MSDKENVYNAVVELSKTKALLIAAGVSLQRIDATEKELEEINKIIGSVSVIHQLLDHYHTYEM